MRDLATIPTRRRNSPPAVVPTGAFVRLGYMSNMHQPTLRQSAAVTERGARGIQPDPDLVEAIAQRVVELIGDGTRSEASARLIDASAMARELGVERDWVYAHASDLGAIRLGGPRGRLRFDPEVVKERLGDGQEPQRPGRWQRGPVRTAGRRKSGGLPRGARVKSLHTQRRASGRTPARSPKQQHTGGSPNDEA